MKLDTIKILLEEEVKRDENRDNIKAIFAISGVTTKTIVLSDITKDFPTVPGYKLYIADNLDLDINKDDTVEVQVLGRYFVIHINSDDHNYDHVEEVIQHRFSKREKSHAERDTFSVFGYIKSISNRVGEAITLYVTGYS